MFNFDESSSSSLRDSSSENIISAVHYAAIDEFVTEKDNKIHKEKSVRLMSIDRMPSRGQLSLSSSSSEDSNICSQYWDTVSFAENFVDNIIEEAESLVNKHSKDIPIPVRCKPSSDRLFVQRHSDDYPVIEFGRPKFTCWPTIGEFTIELGADKIDEYLSSFNTNEEWLYIIYYLGLKNDVTSRYYEYEATWSLPSPEYPIAQATASVFFTIEVSNVIPPECFVNVTFYFESYQFKHRPGLTDFNEGWLNFILDSKIGVFKKITF